MCYAIEISITSVVGPFMCVLQSKAGRCYERTRVVVNNVP